MSRQTELTHEFVKYIPDDLREGVLYISMQFATAAHKCCCGCGNLVITPFGPTDWEMTFNGDSISLFPSIGNWSFDCKSHYWITGGGVKWSGRWPSWKVENGRVHDRLAKERHFEVNGKSDQKLAAFEEAGKDRKPKRSFWRKRKKGSQ